jgi:hypothetical protein
VSSLLVAYLTSYARLSRGGVHEAELYGLDGFLYVPFEEAAATEDLSRHHFLRILYTPANRIDQAIFDGPAPVSGILWRLSG